MSAKIRFFIPSSRAAIGFSSLMRRSVFNVNYIILFIYLPQLVNGENQHQFIAVSLLGIWSLIILIYYT